MQPHTFPLTPHPLLQVSPHSLPFTLRQNIKLLEIHLTNRDGWQTIWNLVANAINWISNVKHFKRSIHPNRKSPINQSISLFLQDALPRLWNEDECLEDTLEVIQEILDFTPPKSKRNLISRASKFSSWDGKWCFFGYTNRSENTVLLRGWADAWWSKQLSLNALWKI